MVLMIMDANGSGSAATTGLEDNRPRTNLLEDAYCFTVTEALQ